MSCPPATQTDADRHRPRDLPALSITRAILESCVAVCKPCNHDHIDRPSTHACPVRSRTLSPVHPLTVPSRSSSSVVLSILEYRHLFYCTSRAASVRRMHPSPVGYRQMGASKPRTDAPYIRPPRSLKALIRRKALKRRVPVNRYRACE